MVTNVTLLDGKTKVSVDITRIEGLIDVILRKTVAPALKKGASEREIKKAVYDVSDCVIDQLNVSDVKLLASFVISDIVLKTLESIIADTQTGPKSVR